MPPLKSLAEIEGEEFVNVLYYGEGGSGKSTAAAHLAKLGKIIYVDAESGVKAKPLRELGVPVENIMPYRVTSYEDLDRLYWSVKDMIDSDPGSVAGVVFDSMTELQKKLMEDIRHKRHVKRTAVGMVDDEFSAEQDEWGKMTEQVRLISRRFRDLDCHVVFVCLAKREIDTDGAFYRPALTPKFAVDMVGYVDVVCYTEQKEGPQDDRSRFVAVTRPVGKARGKDRFGALPAVFPNPTMDRIIEYVQADDSRAMAVADPLITTYYERTHQNPFDGSMVDESTGEITPA